MSAPSVVITGAGVLAGACCGIDALAAVLRSSSSLAATVDSRSPYHRAGAATQGIVAAGVDLTPWVSAAAGRRMGRPSRFATAAANMALVDAGAGTAVDATTAVVMATAFGAIEATEQLLGVVRRDGPALVSPFAFTESVANAPAAHVAIATGAHGPNVTIAQREAGVLAAVGRGALEVAAGRSRAALVGGAEEMAPILHAFLDRFHALARGTAARSEAARPFDRYRNGFRAAEGAAVLLLDTDADARARGARIRARIRGFGGAFDPSAARIGWGRGHVALGHALTRLLERTGTDRARITRIVSGASGTIAGDRLEARVLHEVWGGAPLPSVLAPKSHIGEYGGAFMAAAVLGATEPAAGPTIGFADVDPELGVTPHQGGALPPADITLVTSLASGGAASWLLLERP
ncbi:MAG: beta-ketoacyl synthase chain length factor [Acidobacteria bacterium]|nr:beta-ketoacyl synthase chain length factor [Acidobacteriota bacterium]